MVSVSQAMAFGLFLLDSDNATDRNNITRNKRIKLERFGKIFKVRCARNEPGRAHAANTPGV